MHSQAQNSEGHSYFFECLGCSLVNLTKNIKSFTFIMAFLVDFQNMPYLIKQSQNKPIFLPYRVALLSHTGYLQG